MIANIDMHQFGIMHFEDAEDASPDLYLDSFASFSKFLANSTEDGTLWSPTYPYFSDKKSQSFKIGAFAMILRPRVHPMDLDIYLEGIAHIYYLASTDTPGDYTWNVVMPLAKPVSCADWPNTFARINELFENFGLKECANPSVLYQMPAYRDELDGYEMAFFDGAMLDPNMLPTTMFDEDDELVPLLRTLN